MPGQATEAALPWGAILVDAEGRVLSIEGVLQQYFHVTTLRHLAEVQGMERLYQVFLAMKEKNKPETTMYVQFRDRYYKVVITSFQKAREQLYRIYFLDVTEFHEAEEDLKKRNRQLITLNSIVTAFMEAQDQDPYTAVLDKIMLLGEFDVGIILLKAEQGLRMVGSSGTMVLTPDMEMPWPEGLFPEKENSMIILEETDISKYKLLQKEGLRFFVVIPLAVKGTTEGYLCLGKRSSMTPEFDLVTFLNLLGKNLAMLIERQILFEEMKRLSLTDPLTGLYNIRYFYEAVEAEVNRATRYREVFSVIIFDIDNFKKVNDTYGHQAGDDVLKEVAEVLRGQSRSADTAARYGGEEFVMLLPRTEKTSALQLAERIKDAIEQRLFCPETTSIDGKTKGIRITISGGLAAFPEDGSTVRQLLYRADMALYRAKALGKARVIPSAD